MAFKKEIQVDTEKLIKAIREGRVDDEDLEKAAKIIEEYEKVGPFIKEKDLCKTEHGFWQCPVCRKIPHNAPSTLCICPYCKYRLTEEQFTAQQERMNRIKKSY